MGPNQIYKLWHSKGKQRTLMNWGKIFANGVTDKGLISKMFSTVSVSIYIPTNSVGGFPFLYTLASIYNL